MVCKGIDYSKTKAFIFLSKVSDEKERQLDLILKHIYNSKKNRLLDIGAGSGDIFIPLSTYFENSVAIEPGDKMYHLLKTKTKNNKSIKIYKKKWESFYKTNKQKFDVVLSVHSIYFLEDIKKEINKMKSLLKKGGKLIIICTSGNKINKNRIKYKFTSYFRHKFLGSDLDKRPYFDIPKIFPEIETHRFKSITKLVSFKYLDKDHLSKESEATNYYLKFMLKRWWDEYTEKEKKEMKDFLKFFLSKDKKHYIIPNYDQRIYIYTK
jgi:ubiquinone/menaquinone biosynthesis C-methylase UbiE